MCCCDAAKFFNRCDSVIIVILSLVLLLFAFVNIVSIRFTRFRLFFFSWFFLRRFLYRRGLLNLCWFALSFTNEGVTVLRILEQERLAEFAVIAVMFFGNTCELFEFVFVDSVLEFRLGKFVACSRVRESARFKIYAAGVLIWRGFGGRFLYFGYRCCFRRWCNLFAFLRLWFGRRLRHRFDSRFRCRRIFFDVDFILRRRRFFIFLRRVGFRDRYFLNFWFVLILGLFFHLLRRFYCNVCDFVKFKVSKCVFG